MQNKTNGSIPVLCAYTRFVPTAELRPHPKNPNEHPAFQVELLAKVIQAAGWRSPVTVSNRSGFVITGHGRLLAAKLLGATEVPVDFQDYASEQDEWQHLVADNRLAELAETNLVLLRDLLKDLPPAVLDLTGFTKADLDIMLAPPSQPAKVDAAKKKLAERFGVAPFSVLDARRGEWQDRKRAWLGLGIRSEVGRGGNLLKRSLHDRLAVILAVHYQKVVEFIDERRARGMSEGDIELEAIRLSGGVAPTGSAPPIPGGAGKTSVRLGKRGDDKGQTPNMGGPPDNPETAIPGYYDKLNAGQSREQIVAEFKASKTFGAAQNIPGSDGEAWSGTSIFDPTLTEILYKWFVPPGGHILDPFAGGSVRGVVAGWLGFRYTGIDLRAEQVAANIAQWATIGAAAPVLPSAPAPAPVAVVAPPDSEAKPWQHGFDLAGLKRVREIFKSHDDGLCLGAFSPFKETSIAAEAAEGTLKVWQDADGRPVVAIVCKELKQAQKINDFRGLPVADAQPGDLFVKRMACLPGFESSLHTIIGDCLTAAKTSHKTLWVQSWAEHPVEKAVIMARPLRRVGVKIAASSEIYGLFSSGAPRSYAQQDEATLNKLRVSFSQADLDGLAEAMARNGFVMADHYSSYNKGHTWSAAALRGYGGNKDFIIKPTEMSKKWKEENADKLAWTLSDTPLRDALPEVEKFVAAIPGEKHRVRFMRLTPNGGELLRHADITDPDCGTEPGQTMRIHIPIATNPDVRFTMWNLDGNKLTTSMKCGEAWYLDTRKAHTAGNFGTTERIHLVMDVQVCPELLALLGEEAAVSERVAPAVLVGPEPTLTRYALPHSGAATVVESAPVAEAPLAVTSDPLAITPVQRIGEIWLKRDDLFECGGARGSKARAGLELLKGAKGAVAAGNRESPMVSRVARVAKVVGIPCRCHTADSTDFSVEELDAKAHGAELVKHKIGFLTNLCAKAKADAEASGYTYVALGMESQTYVDITKRQVANIPPEVKRIVLPVGTGMCLSSILTGLSEAGREDVKILGVIVGLDPEPYIEKWSPKNWRERVTLVKADKDFRVPAEKTEWWGIELDTHYEAKAAPFVEPGDLFWCVAIRATATERPAAVERIAPRWVCGDSKDAALLLETDGACPKVDFVFSCPPYADLEVYSEDPRDLSCKAKDSYNEFNLAYRNIVAEACAMLKPGRFACFVVGDVRDKNGNYLNFVSDTIDAFRRAGLNLYNEIILVTSCGSLALRVNKQFSGYRKVGKTHQNVLVFLKGDKAEVKGWPVPDFSLAASDFEQPEPAPDGPPPG